MAIPALEYAEVERKRKGSLEYHPITIQEVPPLTERASRLAGELVPNRDCLFAALRSQLARLEDGELQRTVGYYTAKTAPRCLRLLAYFSTRRVLLLRSEVAGELAEWLSALSKPMKDGDRGLVFHTTESGGGLRGLSEKALEALESNPVKVLKEWAPPRFNRKAEHKRKATHLAKLEQRKGPAADVDVAEVALLFDAFLTRREQERRPEPGDVDARLEAFEQKLGAELPAPMKALYRRTDGARGLFFGHDLLPLEEVDEAWESWRSIYDEWTLDELRGNTRCQKGVTQALYCCPKWIPIIDLVGGNVLAIDLLPGPKGKVGQLIVFGADVETIRCVAPDLKAFLELCLETDGRGRSLLGSVFTTLEL